MDGGLKASGARALLYRMERTLRKVHPWQRTSPHVLCGTQATSWPSTESRTAGKLVLCPDCSLRGDLGLDTDTSLFPPSTAQLHPCSLWSQDGGFGGEIISHPLGMASLEKGPPQSTQCLTLGGWEVVCVQADGVEKGAFTATALSVYGVCQNLRENLNSPSLRA